MRKLAGTRFKICVLTKRVPPREEKGNKFGEEFCGKKEERMRQKAEQETKKSVVHLFM